MMVHGRWKAWKYYESLSGESETMAEILGKTVERLEIRGKKTFKSKDKKDTY